MFTFGRHINPDLAGVYTHNEEDWHQWQDNVMATLAEAFSMGMLFNSSKSCAFSELGKVVLSSLSPFFFVLFLLLPLC